MVYSLYDICDDMMPQLTAAVVQVAFLSHNYEKQRNIAKTSNEFDDASKTWCRNLHF